MLSIHSSPVGALGTLNTGGMSVYVRELARWLGHCGHRIDIFTYAPAPCRHINLYPNVRLIYLSQEKATAPDKAQLPAHIEAILASLERYRRYHRKTYDLIHSHYWISAVVGAMAQTRWHCPHLTMFHTLGAVKNHSAAGEKESIRRIAHERWLAKVADGIVVPSPGERQNLLCHYHPRPEQIHTIPCGVNLDLFQPMDPLMARRKIGIDPKAQVALFVGRFAPVKGINNLLGAMAMLKNRWPKLHLVMVGGDDPENESTRILMRHVRQYNIEKQVTFAGRIDQEALPPFYSAADFLVLPSHYESFGLVVLEALACGTPVVATPVGTVSAIIKENVNGVVIDNSDESGVARAMDRMLNRYPAPSGFQANIRATAIDYSWKRVAASVMNTYALLLDTHEQARTSGVATDPRTYSH